MPQQWKEKNSHFKLLVLDILTRKFLNPNSLFVIAIEIIEI